MLHRAPFPSSSGLLSLQQNKSPRSHPLQGLQALRHSPALGARGRHRKYFPTSNVATEESAETSKGPHGNPNPFSPTRSPGPQNNLLPTAVVVASSLFAGIICASGSGPSPVPGPQASSTPSMTSHPSSTRSRATQSRRAKGSFKSQRAQLDAEVEKGKRQSQSSEAINPVIASMAAVTAGMPKYKGIAAFAPAAVPLLLALVLAPRIANTLRGAGAALSTGRSSPQNNHSSSSSSSIGSGSIGSSRNNMGNSSVEDIPSLTLALRGATSRAQSLLERFADSSSSSSSSNNNSSSSSSLDNIGSSHGNGPSAVPAQGRMAGAGQLLKGTWPAFSAAQTRGSRGSMTSVNPGAKQSKPLAPPSPGRRAAAGGGVRMGGLGTGREAAGTAVITAERPQQGEPNSTVSNTSFVDEIQAQGLAVESGIAGEDNGRKAEYAKQLIAAAIESNRSSSSRWASRAHLRGSGFVLPDDAPKLVPLVCADGSLVFTREQLNAPALASKADVRWVEDGCSTLAEEIRQWSSIIKRGTQREAAEAIQASIDLAFAVLRAMDNKTGGLSSSGALDNNDTSTLISSSIPDISSNGSSSNINSSSSSNNSSIADISSCNNISSSSNSIINSSTVNGSTVNGSSSGADVNGSVGSNGSERGNIDSQAASVLESGSLVSQSDGHPNWEGRNYSGIAQLVDFMADLPEQVEARDRYLQQQSMDLSSSLTANEGAPELAPVSTPTQRPVPSITTSQASDMAADTADATTPAAAATTAATATPPLQDQGVPMDVPSPASPAMLETLEPPVGAMPAGWPSIQEQETAIIRRIQAAADAVKQEGLRAWISAVAQQKEADWQAAAALEAELAEKQEALDVLTQQAQALRTQAAALEEEMAMTTAYTAAAVAEEQRQAEARAAVLQRQQEHRQQLEAEWVQRRAAWSAKEAAEKEEQKVQATKNEERARAAMAEAEARREREAAARAQAEAMAAEEARRAEQAALEAQRAQEQAACEAEAAIQAVAAQRAVLTQQAQAAAEAEAEMQRAAERAAAAATRALEEQEHAARNAEQRQRELAEAQAWAQQARLAAEQDASAAKKVAAEQASMWAQEVAAVAMFQAAVAQQAVLATQALAVAAQDALAAQSAAALQTLSVAKEVGAEQARMWGQEVAAVAMFYAAVTQQAVLATQALAVDAQDALAAQSEAALGPRLEATLSVAKGAAAEQARMWAQEVAAVAMFYAAVTQQAVLAPQALAVGAQDTLAAQSEAALQNLAAHRESTLQDLAARRAAALQRLADKEQQQQQEAAKKHIRYENTEAALETVLKSTPADWSSARMRALRSSARSKYDPLLQLAGGMSVGQWQEVVHELLSLELAVGNDPDLSFQSLEVMSAAHSGSFIPAYRDFERMQNQPMRLAKVHPGISTWLTAASQVAASQNRSSPPAWEPQPVWVALRGRQTLLKAAMEAWPAFTSELEHRHPMLHHLVCRGTAAQFDEEGSCLRGIAVLATLSAWQRTELGKGASSWRSGHGDSYSAFAPASRRLQTQEKVGSSS